MSFSHSNRNREKKTHSAVSDINKEHSDEDERNLMLSNSNYALQPKELENIQA